MNTETPWIARSEREPTEEDLPVLVRYNQSRFEAYNTTLPANSGWTHWQHITPPATETPAQVQEKRDREWARRMSRDWIQDKDDQRQVIGLVFAARRLGREDCRDVVEAVARGEWGMIESHVPAARRLCANFGWKEPTP